ncbi:hypothetical protein VSDG_02065 [Cytospora chrysosperma]|uniref:Oxidase ustYa n=1 Tax=Cytospora chrysosperma TaxID=252740 RepID=A0A423WE57_CYTCH|nr:hypothetical protein VSDG_02065 [Valsa sordida]
MFQSRWLSRQSYSPLQDSSLTLGSQKASTWSRVSWLFPGIILVTVSFALGRLSTTVGKSHDAPPALPAQSSSIADILPLETSSHLFLYNRTFGENSPAADAAWKDLLPHQGGYFAHPGISPQRATFSVYHYLHCLNGLRKGYWAVYDMAVAGEKLDPNDENMPMMISPPHIRHCVDLLRLALMCKPDLTVEVKDEEAGGVHGFGETHQCIDWTDLTGWTTHWESWKQPPLA